MMRISPALPILLLLALVAAAQPDGDDILVDATFVPCSDSVESLLVLRDGRAVYAMGNQGASFTINSALLADLQRWTDSAHSFVDTRHLDSCTTLGVILSGPRYILINTSSPRPEIRDLFARIDRLRKLGQRRMDGTIDRFEEKLERPPDSNMLNTATIELGEVRSRVRLSPIAREWKCSGSVYVAAMVTQQGEVRQAFVRHVRVRGKCASVLATTALRAVLLSTFEPAKNKNGRPMLSWMEIEVPFARPRQ